MNLPINNIENKRSFIHKQIFFYSLILVAVTLPYNLLANSLSAILLFLNWIAEGNFTQKAKRAKDNFLLLLFSVLFYSLHIIGMLYTSNIDAGLFDLQKKLSLLMMPVVLATSDRLSEDRLKTILNSFCLSVLSASLICTGYAIYRTNLWETYSHPYWLYFSYVDLTKIINLQPTYFALFVSFTILIFLFTLINETRYSLKIKLLLSFCTVYLVIFLFLLASRMAIVSLVIIVFGGIIYYSYKNEKLLKGLMIVGVISVCLFGLIYQLPFMKERILQALGVEQNAVWISQYGDGKGVQPEMRTLKWKSALNVIRENWVLGVGTGDTQDALQIEYEKIHFDVGYSSRYNAHNQYLETWLGLGIAGLLALLSCFAVPFFFAFQEKNYIYVTFLMLFFICCITESMLCRQLGVVFYSLFTSLFAFHSLSNRSKK